MPRICRPIASSASAVNSSSRFLLRGVPIRVIAGVKWIEIVAEGNLPEELCREVPEVFELGSKLSARKCAW